MDSKNGSDYAQNYDIIVKWLASALRGQTLDVIGVKTGRIEEVGLDHRFGHLGANTRFAPTEIASFAVGAILVIALFGRDFDQGQEVFGFEPSDISVKTGRVDVMVRDDRGDLYHIEEQRNLQKVDIYRFAAYHFMGAKQWGPHLTDIILASGEVYPGEKAVATSSGRYTPTVIDFSIRDVRKRFAEIRNAVNEGTFENFLELIFLPLYGKEIGSDRSDIVEQVIRFETELFHAKKLSPIILAATLIMSNKLIDKQRIKELWEEIKMLDVLDVAREKGIEEGEKIGIEKGELKATRNLLLNLLFEKFSGVPRRVSDRIKEIEDQNVLDNLFRQAVRCDDMEAFEAVLSRLD